MVIYQNPPNIHYWLYYHYVTLDPGSYLGSSSSNAEDLAWTKGKFVSATFQFLHSSSPPAWVSTLGADSCSSPYFISAHIKWTVTSSTPFGWAIKHSCPSIGNDMVDNSCHFGDLCISEFYGPSFYSTTVLCWTLCICYSGLSLGQSCS